MDRRLLTSCTQNTGREKVGRGLALHTRREKGDHTSPSKKRKQQDTRATLTPSAIRRPSASSHLRQWPWYSRHGVCTSRLRSPDPAAATQRPTSPAIIHTIPRTSPARHVPHTADCPPDTGEDPPPSRYAPPTRRVKLTTAAQRPLYSILAASARWCDTSCLMCGYSNA